ncbi:MAG: shikimate kinase [Pseudomonadota bacterium]
MQDISDIEQNDIDTINRFLPSDHSVVFVGMMGAGKSTVGRKVAFKLQRDFIDTDVEIENSAQLTISEIFSIYGEQYFRDIEQRIICRLLKERVGVISIGGGAFMNETLRRSIAENGISIWLKADFETLMARVHRHDHRPLLEQDDPEKVMRRLIDERYPIYGQSDITVNNSNNLAETTVGETLSQMAHYVQTRYG